MSVITRFAPSPTGFLHVGNARMALINYLFARSQGGKLLLRIDDTDLQRSTKEYEEAIKEDLKWLGLSWDQEEHQSARAARYEEVFEMLRAQGHIYACYETPEELEYMRRRLRARGKPPTYDRGALELTEADIKRYESEGRQPHWRFKIPDAPVEWVDLVQGPKSFDSSNLADPVIRRADGTFLYMLPSAIDDVDMKVTHVFRGEDHVSNTAVQITMFKVMQAELPSFAHLSLLTGVEGGKLSKREGSLSLRDLKEEGLEPMAVSSLLASLGSSDNIEAVNELQILIDRFDITHFGRAAPKFDPRDLDRLNAKIIHDLDFATVAPKLKDAGIDGVDEALWNVARANIGRFNEIRDWFDVCYGKVTPDIEDADFAAQALSVLPEGTWDDTTWKTWTESVKAKTGAKGKNLFMPLRKALTGQPHGPELGALLPLIGREKAVQRLSGQTA